MAWKKYILVLLLAMVFWIVIVASQWFIIDSTQNLSSGSWLSQQGSLIMFLIPMVVAFVAGFVSTWIVEKRMKIVTNRDFGLLSSVLFFAPLFLIYFGNLVTLIYPVCYFIGFYTAKLVLEPDKESDKKPTSKLTSTTKKQMYCSSCGSKLQQGVKFCPYCGQKVN